MVTFKNRSSLLISNGQLQYCTVLYCTEPRPGKETLASALAEIGEINHSLGKLVNC